MKAAGNSIILTSENPEYKPIRINRDRWTTECVIIGVVVGLKGKLSDFLLSFWGKKGKLNRG